MRNLPRAVVFEHLEQFRLHLSDTEQHDSRSGQYTILRADNPANPSWASISNFTASDFLTVLDPISVGTDAAGFFRAQLAADYEAPLIITPPEDQVVPQGATVTFSVTVTGNPPPSYQWQFNGTDRAGQTLSTLTISSAQPTNAGPYTVIVSNIICTASATAWLSLAWTNQLDSAITASPAVSRDGSLIFISTTSRFYALNSANGAVQWSNDIANPYWWYLAPSAAVGDAAVYVASQSGDVFAYSTNGTGLWTNSLGRSIASSLALSAAGDALYLTAEDDPSLLFSLNGATGVTNWSFRPRTPYPPGGTCNASPAIGRDRTVFFLAAARDLWGVHQDGSPASVFPLASGYTPQSSVAIDASGNLLLGSEDGYLYCVSPLGGLKWIFSAGNNLSIASSPAIGSDGTVYAAAYNYNIGEASVFAVTNGLLKWSFGMTNYNAPFFLDSSPAVTADGAVLIGAYDYYGETDGLYVITNGALKTFYPTAGAVVSSPAVSHGAAIFADQSGCVYHLPAGGNLAPDAPWPAFRRNSARTGATPSPTPGGAGPTVVPNNPYMYSGGAEFDFYLCGTPGSGWTIMASTNLADWSPMASLMLDNSGYATFTDTNVAGLASCFYRPQSPLGCAQIIGFVRQTLLPGTNLVANHLFQVNDAGFPQNTAVGWTRLLSYDGLPYPPHLTRIERWNGMGFDTNTWRQDQNRWLPNGDLTVLPGQAAFFINPTLQATNILFMGLVIPQTTTNPIVQGTNFASLGLPQSRADSERSGLEPQAWRPGPALAHQPLCRHHLLDQLRLGRPRAGAPVGRGLPAHQRPSQHLDEQSPRRLPVPRPQFPDCALQPALDRLRPHRHHQRRRHLPRHRPLEPRRRRHRRRAGRRRPHPKRLDHQRPLGRPARLCRSQPIL